MDIYQLVRNGGMKLESIVNESIQTQLNRQETIKLFSLKSQIAAKMINQLQQNIEIISIPLNFPTKKDVANATRINILTEEKIDQLDEKVTELIDSVNELKQWAWKGEKQHEE